MCRRRQQGVKRGQWVCDLDLIDVYDHSHDGAHTLQVLALMQQRLAERNYLPEQAWETSASSPQAEAIQEASQPLPLAEDDILWFHDEETLAWIKKMQQQ